MALEKAQTKLTKEQIQAVAILSIGNLLDQFDKTLHVHLAVLINSLFFPDTHPWYEPFIPALSFVSAYCFTPLGALFFGYLGDVFGRKVAVVLNATITATCCLTVAFLPTYAQIGITATIILTFCRILQSISGLSEVNGAEIYLTESIKPPIQYPAVAFIYGFACVGSMLALMVGAIFTGTNILPHEIQSHSWRFCFLIGATIGLSGVLARRSLSEASEFADRQKLLKEQFNKAQIKWNKENPSINPKISLSTSIAYFFIVCGRPTCFYFIFVECGGLLIKNFGFSTNQVITNNLLVALINSTAALVVTYLSYNIHPFKIMKLKITIFGTCLFLFPLCLDFFHTAKTILLFQCIFATFRLDYFPATPLLIKHFPVLKRFRYVGIIGAIATSSASIIIPISMTFLTSKFSHNGTLFCLMPVITIFFLSVRYFEKQEEMAKNEAVLRQGSVLNKNF